MIVRIRVSVPPHDNADDADDNEDSDDDSEDDEGEEEETKKQQRLAAQRRMRAERERAKKQPLADTNTNAKANDEKMEFVRSARSSSNAPANTTGVSLSQCKPITANTGAAGLITHRAGPFVMQDSSLDFLKSNAGGQRMPGKMFGNGRIKKVPVGRGSEAAGSASLLRSQSESMFPSL